jgi:hypothetical protein
MATSNNDNYLDNNENVSPMMSPNLTSLNESSHMLTHSPRRSVRLSCKSPQMVRKLSNETNIHRTISGGVANIHSPKMNIRNRTSFNNGRGGSNYASTLPPIVLDDGAHIRDENNDMITQNFSLPSDQSEDEEMAPTNNNKNNTTVPRKTSGLASRSEVLSYFDQQPEGYKCKNCTKVKFFINTFPYECFYMYKHQNNKDLDDYIRLLFSPSPPPSNFANYFPKIMILF